jgi:hypothetical protein
MDAQAFSEIARTWQNYYLLTGAAAATLTGLMFIAVTFGSSLVSRESISTARAFIDPALTHFVQVLVIAALLTIPSMHAALLGWLLIFMAIFRALFLVRIFKHIRAAHRSAGDIELSDWLTYIGIPLAGFTVLGWSGLSFIAGYSAPFEELAGFTLVMLLTGVFGAWELLVWMAMRINETDAE